MFEPVEDAPNRVDYVIKYDDLPGSALCVEGGWRMKELELFLEGGLARLSLAKQQELLEQTR